MDVPITRATAAQYDTQNVQFARGPAETAKQIGDELVEIGAHVEKQAQKKALLDYSIGMKQELFRIEQESMGDPEKMGAGFESFKKGYLGKIDDPEVAGLLTEQFLSDTQPAMRRALKSKSDRLDKETATQALIAAGMADKGLENALPGLFSADTGAVEDARKQIEAQAFTIEQSLALKDGEGNPLFSPEKQAEMTVKLREMQDYLGVEGKPAGGADQAIDTVLKNEGGHTPSDGASGAPAIYGINGKWHPEAYAEAKRLTDEKGEAAGKEYAKAFYKKEYWDKYEIEKLPAEVQTVVMDGVVNHSEAFSKKMLAAAHAGATADQLTTMRGAEYERLAKANPEKYGQSLPGWKSRLTRVSGAMPPTIKKAFEKHLDGEMAKDPGKFLQRMEKGEFNQYLDGPTREKYRKEAMTAFKDGEERAKYTRIMAAAATDRAIFDQFNKNAPDLLQKVEDYRNAGGNGELADYMRDNYLKANPISADEQANVYSGLFDRVSQLQISTDDGKTKIGKKDAKLEDVVRLQQEIMKESVRGVKDLRPLLNKLAPAVLAKAKNERGKDDIGEWEFFGIRATEAYDPGYDQIQGYLEGQGKQADTALKADMLREFVARADTISEEIQKDDTLFKQAQQGIARDVIAKQAGKGMKNIPVPAIQRLIANPVETAQFDEIFGAGSANRILGRK